jgi:hypothetical protein
MAEGAGILIVGAAVGFGGKLMRTVSFFGWIFPDSLFGAAGGVAPSGGVGGTAPGPDGIFGLLSAICVSTKLRFQAQSVNSIAPQFPAKINPEIQKRRSHCFRRVPPFLDDKGKG